MLEHLEFKFKSKGLEIFKKYLKFRGVVRAPCDHSMNVLSQASADSEERSSRSRYLNVTSGFLDAGQKVGELNLLGAVTQQVNVLFELDVEEVANLVQACKDIHQEKTAGARPALLNQVSVTQSQFMSSYGGEVCEPVDQSELDDLDTEVQHIARKLHTQRSNQPISTEDIKIEVPPSEQEEKSSELTANEKVLLEERKLFEGSDKAAWASKAL